MMRLFRKRKREEVAERTPSEVERYLHKAQRYCADRLSTLAGRLSSRQLKAMALLFFAACVGLSTMKIYESITLRKRPSAGFRVRALPPPVRPHLELPNARAEIERVDERLRKLKDSSPKIYDSLMRSYPGLLDSLNELRKLK